MTPRLKRHNCKFFTNPMFCNSERRLEHKENQTKYRKITRKSLSHVRILNVGYCYHISCNFSLQKFCTWYTVFIRLLAETLNFEQVESAWPRTKMNRKHLGISQDPFVTTLLTTVTPNIFLKKCNLVQENVH